MTSRHTAPAVRTVGLTATWTTIGVHVDLVNDHLAEKEYVGVLFILAALLLIPVVHVLSRAMSAPAFAYGALVNGGLVCAFIVSRTVGLPGSFREPWTADHGLGLVALASETAFLAAAALVLHRPRMACGGGVWEAQAAG